MKLKKIISILLAAVLISASSVSSTPAKVSKSVENNTALCGLSRNKRIPVEAPPRLEAGLSGYQYKSLSKAAEDIRKAMLNHEAHISTYIRTKNKDPLKLFEQLENKVFKITNQPDEGDYMRWDIDREFPRYSRQSVKEGKTTYYYYKYELEVWYLTTLEQKQQVDDKVDELIQSFHFTETTTDYEKVKAVYDYVCKNVTYSENIKDDQIYTSWAALFQGKAVCQGYAQLIYRMLKELGISVRLIPGFGDYTTQMHGWNIVQLGDYYYNIDATWDSALLKENGTYSYFLKGDNFIDHLRMEEYRTAQFYFQYPMAAEDYGSKTLQRRSANSEKAIFMLIKPEFKKVLSRKIKIKKNFRGEGLSDCIF